MGYGAIDISETALNVGTDRDSGGLAVPYLHDIVYTPRGIECMDERGI